MRRSVGLSRARDAVHAARELRPLIGSEARLGVADGHEELAGHVVTLGRFEHRRGDLGMRLDPRRERRIEREQRAEQRVHGGSIAPRAAKLR